jgi:predicted Zn-dependent peptidase
VPVERKKASHTILIRASLWIANGVRVVSEERLDPTSCVGIAIDKGSLLENAQTKGMSSLMRRMLLTSTELRDGQEVAKMLEEMGASVIRSECSCRDSIYVAAELLEPSVDQFVGLLSEALTHPSFTPQEVEYQKASMEFEREDVEQRDPDGLVEEMMLSKAFPSSSLGFAAVPERSSIAAITVKNLETFHNDILVGPNVVVAG